jgi:DNA-binding beta-propeller fold protein YncE
MKITALLIIVISVSLMSCSRKLYPAAGTDKLIIYPSPPDTARIQFLTRISSSKDVTGNRKSFTKFIFGEDTDILINKPYGITTSKGKILVCDTYIHGIDIIDLENNKFEQFIPSGKGQLKVPINCFVDSKGRLFVADSERKQVVVFDEDGQYLNVIGEAENFKPVDVFVQDDKIWITNLAAHQIYIYSNDSKFEILKKFPENSDGGDASLYSPTNLFVTGNKVYVTDFGDFKIKIFNHNGDFLESVGTYGQAIGQLARPKGLAVDRDSNLFVIDAGFENAQIFNKDGKLLMFFGGTYKGTGDMWLPARISLDYSNLKYFQKYVDPDYQLKYLIYVTNQFGPDKINIYGAIQPIKAEQKQAKTQNKKKGSTSIPKF